VHNLQSAHDHGQESTSSVTLVFFLSKSLGCMFVSENLPLISGSRCLQESRSNIQARTPRRNC
jgi:hypothetical protein